MTTGEHEHDRYDRTLAAVRSATAAMGEAGLNMVGFGWAKTSDEEAFLAAVNDLLVEIGVQADARGLDSSSQIKQLHDAFAAYAVNLDTDNPGCECYHPISGEPHDAEGCTVGAKLTMERCPCEHRSGRARTQVRAWVTPAVTVATDTPFV